MRILWGSNAPFAPSGYGVQTALTVSRMLRDGHEVPIACNWGLDEGMMLYPLEHGHTLLYPKGTDQHSAKIVRFHAVHCQADAIFTHYDAWVFDPSDFDRPWVPWYPVDCDALPRRIEEKIRHAAMRITQTRHGVETTKAAGMDAEYVPAAFDKRFYYPRDGSQWREGNGATGRFVVTMVAANRGHSEAPSRKSYPQAFEAFKMFLEHQPDALLYVHAQPNGQFNLDILAKHYGIEEHVITVNPYFLHTGLYSGDHMAEIYSASDVLLSPSMGEGFGVPIIEAQACGTPVITGDWTAMSEITRTGLAIPKSETVRYPIVTYGDMFLVRPEAIRDALIESTKWKHDRSEVSAKVAEYEIEHVYAEHWRPVLAKFEALIRPNRKQRRARRVTLRDEAVA